MAKLTPQDPRDFLIAGLSKQLANAQEKLDAVTAKNGHLQDDSALLQVQVATLSAQVKLLVDALSLHTASSKIGNDVRPAHNPTTSLFGGYSTATASQDDNATPTDNTAPAAA